MNLLTLKFLKLISFKNTCTLLFMCMLSSSMFAQRSVRIGYIDTEYILENITEYSDANTQLDSKIQKWKSDIEGRLTELEDQKKQLNNERILLTNELISEREEDLQIIENEILEYQQKRFGPNGDLMIQKKQLIQPIQDQIFAAVQEIAASKKYDFIFDKSADVVMLYSADRYDISDRVLKTINRSSKRTQAETRSERKDAEEEETIVEDVDTSKNERQKLLDERKAERALLLEEKRQKKIDARIKAQEAKKQRALERTNTRTSKTTTTIRSANDTSDSSMDSKEETATTVENIDPAVARKKELEAKKKKLKEDREKTQEAKKQKALERRNKKTAKPSQVTSTEKALDTKKEDTKAQANKEKSDQNTSTSKASEKLSDREIRKKALEEKKTRALAARKARLEAQKKTRDSIRNNKQK